MNEKFYTLSCEKQNTILKAGYMYFSQNSYKKTSMSMIADEAEISKSLLFYYFKNKKEYYLYLYLCAIETMNKESDKYMFIEQVDLFEALYDYMENKRKVISIYKYIYLFLNKAYYEEDKEIRAELEIINKGKLSQPLNEIFKNANMEKLKNRKDFQELVNIIKYTAEGFAYVNQELLLTAPKQALSEYKKMLDCMKRYYYKESEL